MKRIIILLFPILFCGCEKYSQVSIPRFTGDKWIFVDYDIVVTNSLSEVTVIKNDTVCINAFNGQSFFSGNVLMRQNYENTSIDRRFVRNKTMWEFASNNYNLYCDFSTKDGGLRPTHDPFWVSISPVTQFLQVQNTKTGSRTVYTYDANSTGAFPATILRLCSPPIVTDLYYSNGSRDKAVTVRVILKFMR